MLCDIIIPVWNRLEFTRECIDSIKSYTNVSFRLIIIDNNSDEETRSYLLSLKKELSSSLILIRNEQNAGFVKAINQGIKASSAEYVCLLNNDTRVEELWLDELINVAKSSPSIGIVNPGGENCSYKNKGLLGKWVEIGFASGFCMLIKREVLEKVGLLDEAYEVGLWEDTDFCQRAKKAGYLRVAAQASCVYHHTHKTFESFRKGMLDELFEKNQEIFVKKWGSVLQIAYVVCGKYIDQPKADKILKLAREGHMVYLFFKNSTKIKAVFNHGGIRQYKAPDIVFHIYVGGKILIRNLGKKRFDKIIIDSSEFAKLLHFLNRNLPLEII